MSKTSFGEQEYIREAVDGGIAEEEAQLMEETKVEPWRKSTRKINAKATTIISGGTERHRGERGHV